MKRLIDSFFLDWKTDPYRKPLLLRGARQVGKTHSVRQFGATFTNFIEINFESDERFKGVFDTDLDPKRISRDLALITDQQIIPGKTLLFFDEIQSVPRALTALRYFYEKLPQQHIIAAGSLIDFTTQSVGIPVGRIASLYVYPLSFIEFLCACGNQMLAQEIIKNPLSSPLSEPVHQKLLELMGEYVAIGGMPEAVARWVETKDPLRSFAVHHALIDTYRQDFEKYATKFQIKYLEALFNAVPRQLGSKFRYSSVEGDYRKRELAPCFDLLATAGIAHPITHTAGQGVPLGAEVNPQDFKAIFLDVALSQAMLGLDLKSWFLDPEKEFVNKGALVEAFVGQELLAYASPLQKARLFYWRKNTPGSEAEVDYLIQRKAQVIPLEVKSGRGTSLASLHMFLESHSKSPFGLRLSTQNYSEFDSVHSYPLYALAHILLQDQPENLKPYTELFKSKKENKPLGN